MEVTISTKGRRPVGAPTHYKIDIANEALKIAIEVDGQSHQSFQRREQDARKDAFLRGLGWIVLRYTNKQVTGHLADVVRMVLSTISRSKEAQRT